MDRIETPQDLARVLRQLRRREARRRNGSPLTFRELAAETGWSRAVIGEYFAGATLPPTGRFDVLVRLLGASGAELGALATARDQVEEHRRTATPPAQVPVPVQLPADVPAFTGRAAELAELDRLAVGPVVISAVAGTAGVGKTALAVHWGHRVRDRFPDGQLYVDLRGYDAGQPTPPGEALAGFLRALGVAGTDLPLGDEERAARFRTVTAGQRLLVVLDNAASVDQVRPLLPGTPSCAVLVTSRDSLAALVARHGARRLDLDLLPRDDAIALLRSLIGARAGARVGDDPEALAALAESCGRLPLALRIAAELVTVRPDRPLPDLVAELADEQRRLDLLDAGGDPRTAVRAVFSWSYRRLPAGTARTFRLLGVHPGADLDRTAAAALCGGGAAALGSGPPDLDILVRAHLVRVTASGRYGLHDLLRVYAAELVTVADDRRGALTRLFDHYLATAAAAMDTLAPAERYRRPRVVLPGVPVPDLTAPDAALAWLDAERGTLVRVVDHAAAHGWPGHAIGLAATLWRYLAGGYQTEALTVVTAALRAARSAGDRAAEAEILINLGGIYEGVGQHGPAIEHLNLGLALCRELGDVVGEARALGNLGLAYEWMGRYQLAADHYEQALERYRRVGDAVGEARTLNNSGGVLHRLGQYDRAVEHHRRALSLYRAAGDHAGEARVLAGIGLICGLRGELTSATEHYERALALFRRAGDARGEAYTLDSLGDLHRRRGDVTAAAEHYERALVLFRQSGDRGGEAYTLSHLGAVHRSVAEQERAVRLFRELDERPALADALNELGGTLLADGQAERARDRHAEALAVAAGIGERYQQARAQHGLALACRSLGDHARRRDHARRALRLYTDLGVPEADEVAPLVAP